MIKVMRGDKMKVMTKKHARIRNFAVILTLIIAVALGVYARQVNKLSRHIDAEIVEQHAQIEQSKQQLEELQKEYDKMDSIDYIKKIATEQLGMVEKDTIVFQIKE